MSVFPINPDAHIPDGSVLEPIGPLNEFRDRVITAEAINRAAATKTEYDAQYPPVTPPPPPTPPTGTPISPGGPVTVDDSKYMIDAPVFGRLRRR